MFHSNGDLYLLYEVVSNKNNPLHNKIVNTTCDLELFEVGKPGVFSAELDDGEFHRVLTSTVARIELPDGYDTVIVHTRNSVYTFYRIIPEIVAAAKMGDSQNVGE